MYPDLFLLSSVNENCNKINLNPVSANSQKNILHYSSFYETSYFWYLKRFYFLNTLSTNVIKSGIKLADHSVSFYRNSMLLKNKKFDQYELLTSYLLKSSLLNMGDLNHSIALCFDFSKFDSLLAADEVLPTNFIFALKDIYLLNTENDLFSKDALTLLYWVTMPNSNNNNITFFNYLDSTASWRYLKPRFYNSKTHSPELNNFIYFLTYSLIDLDKFYLTDIAYLSLFY